MTPAIRALPKHKLIPRYAAPVLVHARLRGRFGQNLSAVSFALYAGLGTTLGDLVLILFFSLHCRKQIDTAFSWTGDAVRQHLRWQAGRRFDSTTTIGETECPPTNMVVT